MATTLFPHCAWSYAIGATLEAAFANMTESTRESFMEGIRQVSDFEAPMLLPGIVVDATDPTVSPINIVQVVVYKDDLYQAAQ